MSVLCSCVCVCVHVLRVRSSAVRGAVRGAEQSPSSPGTSWHRVAVSCPSPRVVPCRGAGSVAVPWVRGPGPCRDQGWCPEPPQPCPARAPRSLWPQKHSRAAARPSCRAGGGAAVPPGPSEPLLKQFAVTRPRFPSLTELHLPAVPAAALPSYPWSQGRNNRARKTFVSKTSSEYKHLPAFWALQVMPTKPSQNHFPRVLHQ